MGKGKQFRNIERDTAVSMLPRTAIFIHLGPDKLLRFAVILGHQGGFWAFWYFA